MAVLGHHIRGVGSMSSSRRITCFVVLFSSGHRWLFFVASLWACVVVASRRRLESLRVVGSSFRRLRYILESGNSTSQTQDGNHKVKGQKNEMSEFSLQVSPSCNLKNHVSSIASEVIRLLESFSMYGNDEDQQDFTLYKLEQIVYLCVNGQNIWSDFLTGEIIQLLLTAYNSPYKENGDTHSSQPSSSCQLIIIHTCPVGLGGGCRNPSLNYITIVIFRFGVQKCLGLFTRMYYKIKWLFPSKNCIVFLGYPFMS